MRFDLLCHCHLRWDFVWQRPQHLMTRMARYRRVFFLEDAAPLAGGDHQPRVDIEQVRTNLLVARPLLLPHTGQPDRDGEVDRQNGELFLPMLKETLARHGFGPLVHWFYTPMAYWLADAIPHEGIVYDCMDELSLFKNAPPGILERERELLDCADLVFTGGRSLFLSKSERHPNVQMFPSGVEVEHFGKACSPETPVPADIDSLPGPRFTYAGVIDERLDLDLVRQVATQKPDWQIVMIGPVVKIEADQLPRLPNIHYLGRKPYEELPGYLKGTDVAIMPFALNDATRFISPTKTLEYMAARRPVVSTPIADVVAYYDRIAWVAEGADAFVKAGEEALHADPKRLAHGVESAQSQTWDSIAERMNDLLEKCLTEKGTDPCSTIPSSSAVAQPA